MILPKYRAPFEKQSIGDLKICFLNIYRLVWKLSSKVRKAKNLKKPLISEKPKENRKTKKVMNPYIIFEVKLLIYLVLTS